MNVRCLTILCAAATGLVASAASLPLSRPTAFGGFAALAFSPDGTTLAGGLGKLTYTSNNVVIGADAGGLALWDPATGKIRSQLGPVGETVDGLAWTADGRRLLGLNSELGRVHVYDPSLSAPLRTLNSPEGALFVPVAGRGPAFAVSPDGRRVAVSGSLAENFGSLTARSAGSLTLWDIATGNLLWSQTNAGAQTITFAQGGATVVAFTQQVAWSVDGSGNLSGLVTGQALEGWNAADGARRFQVPMNGTNVSHLVTSPDGAEVLVLAGRRSGWHDPATGARTRPQPFPITASLERVQLDPSGDRLLLTEASGARVQLFQFSTGSALELLTITSIADRFRFTAVSPDFTRLAAITFTSARLIDLPMPRIISLSESSEGVEFQVEAPAGTFSELRFRTDLDSPWTAVQSVLPTTNRFVLRDNDPTHRAASAGFWQVHFQ